MHMKHLKGRSRESYSLSYANLDGPLRGNDVTDETVTVRWGYRYEQFDAIANGSKKIEIGSNPYQWLPVIGI